MTKQQIPVLAARLVEFQEEFSRMFSEDGQWAIQNTAEAIFLFIDAVANRKKPVDQPAPVVTVLGDIVSSAVIHARTEKFVAENELVLDTGKQAKVKISYLGDNFKNWFFGKEEILFSNTLIHGRQLNKNSVDGPILAELGGQEKAKTTLAEIYAMMECQANGESGPLLNNGYVNIFYVPDVNGTLRAVDVYWDDNGWNVDAYSVEDPDEWLADRRVFSRNSSGPQNV